MVGIEAPALAAAAIAAPSALHQRRLREVWRSAGWPCKDNLELDLLAAGLLASHWDVQGRETLRPTEAGLQVLAAKRQRHQRAFSAHEALVSDVVRQQQRAGRVVWRGLCLRAPLPAAAAAAPPLLPGSPGTTPEAAAAATAALACAQGEAKGEGSAALPDPPETPEAPAVTWALAMPDVYAIRHTTVEDYVAPVAFEIKVSRADLLSDLRRPAKAAAYLALASQCWYVLRPGIARLEEIPPCYGVMEAPMAPGGPGLLVLRPAPARPLRLPFPVWMALARANAEPPADEPAQASL